MLDWLAGLPWSEHGCRVVGACLNGEQALRLAREDLPDLVLTDIVMPLMDGLDLTRALKALKPRVAGDPAVLLPGVRLRPYRPATGCTGLPAQGAVFTPDQLFAVVDRCRQALSGPSAAPTAPVELRYPAEVYWLRPHQAADLPRLRALLEQAQEILRVQDAPETRGLLALLRAQTAQSGAG